VPRILINAFWIKIKEVDTFEMVQYVITPWRNRQELLHIRDLLYPEKSSSVEGADRTEQDVDERKMHAVANVSVWVQRGNCPHLVESTAILMSAVLNDVPGNSTYCVRAAYAAAFCRSVAFSPLVWSSRHRILYI
jgi:ribosomal biogenesis protein LAS1